MKRISLLLCWMMVLCIVARAENYPYRSDVLWVTVPNHADWLYETGEKATVEVQLYKYGIPQDDTFIVESDFGLYLIVSDEVASGIHWGRCQTPA